MMGDPRTACKRHKTSRNHNFPIPYFTSDILVNIFCRLPLKIIIQFKQVCKEWRDIILDPHFAELHYNRTTSHLSVVSYRNMSNIVAQEDSIYLVQWYKQQQHYKLMSSRFKVGDFTNNLRFEVLNSCRGFLLLKTQNYYDNLMEYGFDLHVYNPLTNEHLKLPRVAVNNLLNYTRNIRIGLGFSPVTKQYKIVRLVSLNNDTRELHIHVVGTDVTWRRVEIKNDFCDLQFKEFLSKDVRHPLALNGVLHWIDTWQKIACFNVHKEEFNNAMDSPCLEDSEKYIVSIGMVHGLLCLGLNLIGNSPNGVEMWVMREYGVRESWTKYVTLRNDNIIGKRLPNISRPKLVHVCDNGEMVLLPKYPHFNLILHNQKDKSFKRLSIRGFDKNMLAEIYVPSFFSIKNHIHAN